MTKPTEKEPIRIPGDYVSYDLGNCKLVWIAVNDVDTAAYNCICKKSKSEKCSNFIWSSGLAILNDKNNFMSLTCAISENIVTREKIKEAFPKLFLAKFDRELPVLELEEVIEEVKEFERAESCIEEGVEHGLD